MSEHPTSAVDAEGRSSIALLLKALTSRWDAILNKRIYSKDCSQCEHTSGQVEVPTRSSSFAPQQGRAGHD